MNLTENQLKELALMYTNARQAMDRHLEKIKANPQTIDDLFDFAPDGDFEWNDLEAGDWHVYCCGEKDCPRQWHLVSYYQEMGQECGSRWIYLGQVDEDGNSDIDIGYDEREGDDPDQWYWVAVEMAMQINEYFYGWFQYWAEAAQTGVEVLDQSVSTDPQDYFKNAVENYKYLVNP